VEQYLERLVAAGHNLLDRTAAESEGPAGILRFLLHGFPALVRESRAYVAAAASVWVLGVLLSYGVATVRFDLARDLCPQSYLDRAERAAAMRNQEGTAAYIEMEPAFTPMFSSQLVANNVQATFVAFALGVTAGLGTTVVLLLNGVLFGAVAAVFAREGVGDVFWTFVAGHGFVEIPAFLIAAAGGLRLGGALLRPGARTRGDALVQEAVEAGRLLGGTTVLLVVAALIESFVSPSGLPAAAKVAIGLTAGAGVLAWLLLGGRRRPADPAVLAAMTGSGPASILGRRR
jgi:uncharacterized membrane protein SpoIIM required for sporulation